MNFFTPDGKSLIFYEDRQLVFRDVVTNEKRHTIDLQPYNLSQFHLEFSPDGMKLLLLALNLAPRLLDVSTGAELQVFTHPDFKSGICGQIAHDGGTVLVSDPNVAIFRWDVQTGQVVQRYHHQRKFLNFAISKDQQFLVGGGNWAAAGVWDVTSSQQLFSIPGNNQSSEIGEVVVLPDDQHALICDGANGLIVHLASGQVVHQLDTTPETLVLYAAVAHGANLFITNAFANTMVAHLWDADTWELVATLTHPEQDKSPCYVGISPDGLYAVTVPAYYKQLYVWDLTSKTVLYRRAWHDYRIY